jgi:hypothetical protein
MIDTLSFVFFFLVSVVIILVLKEVRPHLRGM